jgi:hypothetical protein
MSDFYYKKAKKYKLKYLNLKQEYIGEGGGLVEDCSFEKSQIMINGLYNPNNSAETKKQILDNWMMQCDEQRLISENSPGLSSEKHIVDIHDEHGDIIHKDQSYRNKQYFEDMKKWDQKQEQQQQYQQQLQQYQQPEPEPEPEPEQESIIQPEQPTKKKKKRESCTIS